LINVSTGRCRPGAPLIAVDWSQFAIAVGPLIPNGYPLLVKPFDVRRTLNEPQQLTDDRPGVQLLRSQQRKTLTKIKAHLIAECAQSARTGSVALRYAMRQDMIKQIQVRLHDSSLLPEDSHPEPADRAAQSGAVRRPALAGWPVRPSPGD